MHALWVDCVCGDQQTFIAVDRFNIQEPWLTDEMIVEGDQCIVRGVVGVNHSKPGTVFKVDWNCGNVG